MVGGMSVNDLIIKNVPFCQAELLAVQDKETGKIYAGINGILRELGFDDKQVEYRRGKWTQDKVIEKGTRKFSGTLLGAKTGKNIWCIDIKKLPIALAKIEITPKMENEMPELSDKLEKYQDECADILAEAFLKQEEERKESLETVNETVKIFTDLMQKAGCSAEIQLLTVKTIIENNTGMVLPVMVQSDKQYYDTEYIARKVGIYVKSSGKPAEKAVSEIIRRLDISEDMYTETWETNGKWQGTVRKYTDDVIKMVLNWCEENGYPNDIEYIQSDGQKKKYHVKWKEVA